MSRGSTEPSGRGRVLTSSSGLGSGHRRGEGDEAVAPLVFKANLGGNNLLEKRKVAKCCRRSEADVAAGSI